MIFALGFIFLFCLLFCFLICFCFVAQGFVLFWFVQGFSFVSIVLI